MNVPISVDINGIPDELKAIPHWVVWRWTVRNGKPDKPPCDPATGRPTDATDRASWMSFDRVVGLLDRFDGIGFAVSESGLVGVDLDRCRDGSGSVADWALEIVRQLDSYCEITPSGQGLRVWVRGELPPGRRRKGQVEFYDSHRYFTVTGRHLDGTPTKIHERTAELASLHARLFPQPSPTTTTRGGAVGVSNPDDDTILKRMFRAKNGAKVESLFQGTMNGYVSESEADLALCSHLAFWTGGDIDAIDRLFRRSGLCRDKWKLRDDYRDRTIARALTGARFYDPNYRSYSNGPFSEKPIGRIGSIGVVEVSSEEWEPPTEREPVEPVMFPLDVFPVELQDLCRSASEALQAPVDFFAATALAFAGGAIGRSVCLKVTNTWEVSSNLFLAIVGGPGSKKSPALKMMAGPLYRIDSELREQYLEEKREWAERDPKNRGPEPIHHHLTLDDATREAFAKHLAENPRGVILVKDELVSWVAALNAYRQGKGDDKQFWMSLNTGSLIKVTRKGSPEPIYVPHPFAAVVGCLPPGMIHQIRNNHTDDGWLDRILFAYPDPAPRARTWTRVVIPEELLARWEQALRILWGRPLLVDDIEARPRPYFIRMTAQGEAQWAKFYEAHHADQCSLDFPQALLGPWSKLEGFTLRFATILAQIHQAYDPTRSKHLPADVDALDIWGATRLTDYFKTHFRRARELLSGRPETLSDDAWSVLSWIQKENLESFTARDVGRKFSRFGARAREEALRELMDERIIRFAGKFRAGGTVGRCREVYEVNPYLEDHFHHANTANTANRFFRKWTDHEDREGCEGYSGNSNDASP